MVLNPSKIFGSLSLTMAKNIQYLTFEFKVFQYLSLSTFKFYLLLSFTISCFINVISCIHSSNMSYIFIHILFPWSPLSIISGCRSLTLSEDPVKTDFPIHSTNFVCETCFQLCAIISENKQMSSLLLKYKYTL